MPRPSTEAEYLARIVPTSWPRDVAPDPAARRARRRRAPRRPAAARVVQLLGWQRGRCHRRWGGGGTVTLGSNQSDAVPKAAIQAVMDAFQKANSGLTVKINTIDHNSFQENINNYLQGSPDDVWIVVLRLPDAVLRLQGPRRRHLRRLGNLSGHVRRAEEGVDGGRRQAVLRPLDLLPVGDVLPQERLGREGLHRRRRPSTSSRPSAPRCRRTASSRSPSPTRTAGRRWAPSTSSTCGSTATTSTSA